MQYYKTALRKLQQPGLAGAKMLILFHEKKDMLKTYLDYAACNPVIILVRDIILP